jgi:hypothetical protein
MRASLNTYFDKHISCHALRAETALPPQHRWTQCPFGCIVGWFYPFQAHKCPERLPMRQQFVTQPFGRVIPSRSGNQSRLDDTLNRLDQLLQLRSVNRPTAEAMPELKDQFAQAQQIRSPGPQATVPLGQRPKIANQVRPTELTALWRHDLIGFQAVGTDQASKGGTQECGNHLAAATGCHMKERGNRTDNHPQPAALAALLPAGFVHVDVALLLDAGLNGLIDRCERRTDGLLQVDHTTEADRQGKQIVEQSGDLAITQAIAAMQHGDSGGRLRPKAARRDICGSFGRGQVATAGAADRMIVMRGNQWAHQRDIPHVLDAHGTSISQRRA